MSLFERNYMHEPRGTSPQSRFDDWRTMLWTLIGINALFYFIIAPPGSQLYMSLMLLGGGPFINQLYQLVTAAFLHANFSHILFNMYGLYLFGGLVGPHIGGWKFLTLYLIGGVTGNLLFLACNFGEPTMIVGASGAVCAMMSAAALLEPNRRFVMIFMPFFPLKTVTLVIGYTVIEVLLQITGTQDGVAHLAHLGGFLGGYIYLKLLFKNNLPWDPFRRKARPGEWRRPPEEGSSRFGFGSGFGSGGNDANRPVSSAELDALLDKVSRNGINSLSEYELTRLKKAREQMRGR